LRGYCDKDCLPANSALEIFVLYIRIMAKIKRKMMFVFVEGVGI